MKFIFNIFIIITSINCYAQNLVPNYSFENYSSCPTFNGQITLLDFWITTSTNLMGISGTPDYYNECAVQSSYVSVPVNGGGSQHAHNGAGYAGITLREGTNFREYIEVQLTVTLAKQCYHFEMYVNLADVCRNTTDAIGVYFSDTVITGINNSLPLPFIPQITNLTGYITDTLNWTLISGDYNANGGENYLIIGNFKDDFNSSFLTVNPAGQDITYFYIDDVSLTLCTVGINEISNKIGITIFPNPSNDKITITSENSEAIKQISISDLTGRVVYKTSFENKSIEVETDVSFLPVGTYFINITTNVNNYYLKIIIVKQIP